MMETGGNESVARRWFEDFFNARQDMVEEIVAPEHLIHDAMHPDLPLGPQGSRVLADRWLGAFSDAQITINDAVVEADDVVHRWTATGTHDGPLGSISPTQAQVSVDGITISHLSDGKIVETWNAFDAADLLNQIGHLSGQHGGGEEWWKWPPW